METMGTGTLAYPFQQQTIGFAAGVTNGVLLRLAFEIGLVAPKTYIKTNNTFDTLASSGGKEIKARTHQVLGLVAEPHVSYVVSDAKESEILESKRKRTDLLAELENGGAAEPPSEPHDDGFDPTMSLPNPTAISRFADLCPEEDRFGRKMILVITSDMDLLTAAEKMKEVNRNYSSVSIDQLKKCMTGAAFGSLVNIQRHHVQIFDGKPPGE